MANPRDTKKIPITWSDDLSQPIKINDFRNVVITLVGTGAIQVLGSAEKNPTDTPPDFTAPSTIDNAFEAIVMADLTAPNTYATTISVTSATKLAEVNTNLLTFISLSRSVDTVDAYVTVCDNQ